MSMLTVEDRPCSECESLAYTGRHEPYVVDDVEQKMRVWQCSLCRTLWLETEHAVVPTTYGHVDGLVPGWWERSARLVADPLDRTLARLTRGEETVSGLGIALLRHRVWWTPADRGGASTIETWATESRGSEPVSGVVVFTHLGREEVTVVGAEVSYVLTADATYQIHADAVRTVERAMGEEGATW